MWSACIPANTNTHTHTRARSQLPHTIYLGYFGPDYRLHITPSNMENYNSRPYMKDVLEKLMRILDVRYMPMAELNGIGGGW